MGEFGKLQEKIEEIHGMTQNGSGSFFFYAHEYVNSTALEYRNVVLEYVLQSLKIY